MPSSRRPFAVLAAALALTAATLVGAPHAVAAGTGNVAGVVRDDRNAPVGPGVVVTARTPQDEILATTTTDAAGSYLLAGVPAGLRVVCFDGAGLTTTYPTGFLVTCSGGASSAATASPVRVVPGRTATLDATLRPAAVVTGRVTDPAGAPLAGVVVGTGYLRPTYVTDADGTFRAVTDQPYPQSFQFCFDGGAATGGTSLAGYLPACYTAPRTGNPYVTVTAGQVTTVDQVLQPAAAITGRVTDAAGNPLGGVRVNASAVAGATEYGQATSLADGSYRVGGLRGRARYSVLFDATGATGGTSGAGYLDVCYRRAPVVYHYCSTPGATSVGTTAGLVTDGVSVTLPAATGISGAVTDRAGRPLPDMPVDVEDERGGTVRTTTDATGRYTVTRLDPAVSHRVCTVGWPGQSIEWPDRDGYVNACWSRPGGGGAGYVPTTPGVVTARVDLALTGRGGIAGTALAPDGHPAEGVFVEVRDDDPDTWDATGRTGADGNFRVGELAPGSYSVCLAGDDYYATTTPAAPYGFARQCRDAVVGDDTTVALPTTTLVPGGRISGHVTDAGGFALAGVAVVVTDTATGAEAGRTVSASYDDLGGYAVDFLSPGRYTVCFDATNAYRAADGGRPRAGYANGCWDRTVAATATPVTVESGQDRSGTDARLPVARTP